ncbi:hypothetical protein BC332_12313 [Capsicum chinense]|nr:hypothetical protein BC332_12313 [Capsicum chinense]
MFVKFIWKCFYEESNSENSQDDDMAIERARVMEVVIDIPDDEEAGAEDGVVARRKTKGTNSDCCICLGEFEQQDDTCELILSACCHRFHVGCVLPWLFAKNMTCPLCRTNISTIVTYARVEDLNKLLNGHQGLQFSDTDRKNYTISVHDSIITLSIQENPIM